MNSIPSAVGGQGWDGSSRFLSARISCKPKIMLMSIPVNTKRQRGRPPGRDYVDTIAVRMKRDQSETLDAWRESQPDKPSRSEAIRRLVEEALKAKRS